MEEENEKRDGIVSSILNYITDYVLKHEEKPREINIYSFWIKNATIQEIGQFKQYIVRGPFDNDMRFDEYIFGVKIKYTTDSYIGRKHIQINWKERMKQVMK